MSVRVLSSFSTGYPYNARAAALLPQGNDGQVRLVSARVINNSGSTSDIGLFQKFGSSFNFLSATASAATDITASLLAGNTDTIIATAINDGFLVGSKNQFNLIGLFLMQAQTGAPVYAFEYWNGTAWTALNTIAAPTAFSNVTTETLIVFGSPVDWAVGATGLTGLDPSQFYIRVIATTATTQAVTANSVWVASMLDFMPSALTGSSLYWSVENKDLALGFSGSDGLLPYFATAGAKNLVTGQYIVHY